MTDKHHLVVGSLSAIAARDNTSLASVFMDCDHAILVDTSGSMDERDSTGGRSRYDVACDELRKLQRDLPGKLAIFSYSSDIELCPSGVPVFKNGGTAMYDALEYVSDGMDGAIKSYIVISDGYPDPGTGNSIIALAGRLSTPVNTIFAGPVEDKLGREFMAQLALAGRGKMEFSANAAGMGDSAMKLLK